MIGRISSRRATPLALVVLVLAVGLYTQLVRDGGDARRETAAEQADHGVLAAFAARQSGIMVATSGRVERVLPDDLKGSRHQRFILRVEESHTVLVAHNIDLAPRVPLGVGDSLSLRGQYEWTELGGTIHWTHHDPDGTRPGGWIHHGDRLYR